MMYPWSGKVLRFANVEFPPWYIPYYSSDATLRLGGLYGNMLGNITQSLNMTYEVFPPSDGQYGMAFPDGTMNGMLRMVMKDVDEADIATGPFTLSDIINQHLHTPPPPAYTYLVMLSGMRTAYVSKTQSFTNSFDRYVWIGLLVSFVTMTLLMAFYERIILQRFIRTEQFLGFVFELFQTLLQEASKTKFKGPCTRVLGAAWLAASFIFGQSFSGQARAILIVQTPTERINTIEDLVARPELTIFYAKNTPLEPRMKNIVGYRGDLLRSHIEANSIGMPVPIIYNDDVRARLVDKKGVIFMDRQSVMSTVYRWCVETNDYFYVSEENLVDLPGLWYTSKLLGKELNNAMDLKILWLFAMGIKFLPDLVLYRGHTECVPGNTMSASDMMKPTHVHDLESVFHTFVVCTLVSIVSFMLELLIFYSSRCCGCRKK
ncbi:hypothetical protein BIW11_11379, partial [Tropilaelaps mercedesae]